MMFASPRLYNPFFIEKNHNYANDDIQGDKSQLTMKDRLLP